MASSPLTANVQGDNGVEETSDKQTKFNDQVFDYAPKVRKPYTITKERERWTDEEHNKFVEALKLYGRAWRKIEEHVSTKTAVQIRSHAQKFFSKVAREASGGNESSLEPIVIPPPRPKRKPMHPYPRKGDQASERDNGSPTSVLSTVGSEALGSSFDSHSPNRSLSPVSSASPPATTANAPTKQSLKLFGKTVLVSDPDMVSSLITSTTYCKSPVQPLPRKLSRSEELLSCWIPVLPKQEEVEEGVQNEGSSTGSNAGSVDDTGHTEKSSEPHETIVCQREFKPSVKSAFSELRRRNSESKSRGFGPYKKRKLVIQAEEEEEIRLYL